MITFNNIPTTIRTPGTFVEIDNSRAIKGLVANPHKVIMQDLTRPGLVCSILLIPPVLL